MAPGQEMSAAEKKAMEVVMVEFTGGPDEKTAHVHAGVEYAKGAQLEVMRHHADSMVKLGAAKIVKDGHPK